MTSSNADGLVKVVVKLEKDEDDYPPVDYEGLWALPVGEGLFQIDNVPFFARGIAHGDIVSATSEQQELRFREVVRPSGHSTLRLIIYDEKDIPFVRALLEEQGCSIEQSHIPGLISVDAPPSVSLAVLRTALDEGEAQGRWGYEEACVMTMSNTKKGPTPSPFEPELAEILPAFAGFVPVNMTAEQIEKYRAMPIPPISEQIGDRPVQCVDFTIPGYQGVDMVVSVISRKDHARPGPGIYHVHGGGMVMANRFAGASDLVAWAMKFDAVCVTVEYRRAPENPDPIPVEDCYAGLEWMAAHAKELLVDPERIIIFGGSAGGGLSAGTTLLARDRKGPKLFGQLLQCPMIDDRNETVSSHQYQGIGIWDRVSNLTGWTALLGDRRGTDNVSIYAAPARATDLSGLPPTFIDVGAAEVFRDESVAYASAIWAAGGEAELHVWGGAFHGFSQMAPDAAISRAANAAREAWLERMLSRR